MSDGDLSNGADSANDGDVVGAAIINMPTAELLALLACRRDPADLIEGLIEHVVRRVEAQMKEDEARARLVEGGSGGIAVNGGRGRSTSVATPSSEEVDLVSLE